MDKEITKKITVMVPFEVMEILLREHKKFQKIEVMYKSRCIDLEELRKIVMEDE